VRRAAAWIGIGVLVLLVARLLAYSLVPQPTVLSLELEHSLGGPRLLVVAAWSIGLAGTLASLAIGLAVVSVRERLALERAIVLSSPRLRPARLCVRYVALLLSTSLAFAVVESYLHWRSGLGWHGIHCLTGPAHRDAIPLLAALALIAVACFEAAELLLAWARRELARFLPVLPIVCAFRWPAIALASRRRRSKGGPLPPRGPPVRLGLHVAHAI
jgi:hypothetical protein